MAFSFDLMQICHLPRSRARLSATTTPSCTRFDENRALARTGQHRSVGMADLLIASVAAHHEVTVIHCDSDFETAAGVIPFEHRWVVERGTVD